MTKPILLTTLNARYHHSSFGLRYLLAQLEQRPETQGQTHLQEFTISQNPKDIVEKILELNPKIVGLGVYIWNTDQTLEVVSILKAIRPEILIVLGGPEVSYEYQDQPLCERADFVFIGESDISFSEFCASFLTHHTLPQTKWISSELPEVKKLASPYRFYTDEDIRHRVIYVEASRGCPYKCEYCLSSLDKSVRSFDIDSFLNEMNLLIERGVRSFKFVDRTFNLSISTSSKILTFFLERINLGLFLHFEMVPDRLPIELRELISQFPAGSLQFEIGIQTWNPTVARNVSRRQDYEKIRENIDFLSHKTGVHLHVDLIAGLPGEDLQSFARGFDAVTSLTPHEVQLGILKRLKGTPISRHEQPFQMIYQTKAPFQILQNKDLSYQELQSLSRFANFWDLYSNSGNFPNWMSLLRQKAQTRPEPSYFAELWEFFQFLTQRHTQGHSIALLNLVESAWIYGLEKLKIPADPLRKALISDYAERVKRDIPKFLRTDSTPLLKSQAHHERHKPLTHSQESNPQNTAAQAQTQVQPHPSHHLPKRQLKHVLPSP